MDSYYKLLRDKELLETKVKIYSKVVKNLAQRIKELRVEYNDILNMNIHHRRYSSRQMYYGRIDGILEAKVHYARELRSLRRELKVVNLVIYRWYVVYMIDLETLSKHKIE